MKNISFIMHMHATLYYSLWQWHSVYNTTLQIFLKLLIFFTTVSLLIHKIMSKRTCAHLCWLKGPLINECVNNVYWHLIVKINNEVIIGYH
jgi:hypothetical protein